MYIDDLFPSPSDRIRKFAEMQVHLYRHDVRLQDYFLALQLDRLTSPRITSANLRPSNGVMSSAVRRANKISRTWSRRKIKADVLFCPVPYFNRETENRLLANILLGLAQTDAKVVCLLPASAPVCGELESKLAAIGRKGQVTFLDLDATNPLESRLRWRAARTRAQKALEEIVGVLEPHGLNVGQEVEPGLERAAYFVEAWEALEPWIEFDSVVTRCHWHVLCSPVSRTGSDRGKPTVTFQQGVIGTTLDVPVTASRYVAFGEASASLMSKVNGRFFKAAGVAEPRVEFLSGGSLFDHVTPLPDQFDQQTVLMVDLAVEAGDFHGLENQRQSLIELADQLLAADLPLRRVLLRPHPHWTNLDLEDCQNLVRKHPFRCELSHPVWSLTDDLRRSSVVVGIFSGVLTVASACGLPTVFLQTANGFSTSDLAPFAAQQMLLPDAFREISKLLLDRQAYASASAQAMKNASGYYANGTNLEFSGAFFERVLRAAPQQHQASYSLQ
jgi:hypothetical protein